VSDFPRIAEELGVSEETVARIVEALGVEDDFYPTTPREALLAVLIALREVPMRPPALVFRDIENWADKGLRGNESFLLTDALADRLAEAHGLIKQIGHEPPSLPPDLEAMVERRWRTR